MDTCSNFLWGCDSSVLNSSEGSNLKDKFVVDGTVFNASISCGGVQVDGTSISLSEVLSRGTLECSFTRFDVSSRQFYKIRTGSGSHAKNERGVGQCTVSLSDLFGDVVVLNPKTGSTADNVGIPVAIRVKGNSTYDEDTGVCVPMLVVSLSRGMEACFSVLRVAHWSNAGLGLAPLFRQCGCVSAVKSRAAKDSSNHRLVFELADGPIVLCSTFDSSDPEVSCFRLIEKECDYCWCWKDEHVLSRSQLFNVQTMTHDYVAQSIQLYQSDVETKSTGSDNVIPKATHFCLKEERPEKRTIVSNITQLPESISMFRPGTSSSPHDFILMTFKDSKEGNVSIRLHPLSPERTMWWHAPSDICAMEAYSGVSDAFAGDFLSIGCDMLLLLPMEKKSSKKKSKKRKRSEHADPEKPSKSSSNFMRGFVLTNNDKAAPLCILDKKHSSTVSFPDKERFKSLSAQKHSHITSGESDATMQAERTVEKISQCLEARLFRGLEMTKHLNRVHDEKRALSFNLLALTSDALRLFHQLKFRKQRCAENFSSNPRVSIISFEHSLVNNIGICFNSKYRIHAVLKVSGLVAGNRPRVHLALVNSSQFLYRKGHLKRNFITLESKSGIISSADGIQIWCQALASANSPDIARFLACAQNNTGKLAVCIYLTWEDVSAKGEVPDFQEPKLFARSKQIATIEIEHTPAEQSATNIFGPSPIQLHLLFASSDHVDRSNLIGSGIKYHRPFVSISMLGDAYKRHGLNLVPVSYSASKRTCMTGGASDIGIFQHGSNELAEAMPESSVSNCWRTQSIDMRHVVINASSLCHLSSQVNALARLTPPAFKVILDTSRFEDLKACQAAIAAMREEVQHANFTATCTLQRRSDLAIASLYSSLAYLWVKK